MYQEISIIIPVYNATMYLERCVESIVYGEYRNVEVILIEDCSQDDSWQLCQLLAERFDNVRCYKNEKNSGVSYTRNHGLKKAQGEYVIFVDSDDWVSGKYAKYLHAEVKKSPNELVICGLHFLDKVVGYRREYLWDNDKGQIVSVEKERFFDLVDCFLLQQLWNKIFDRNIIEKYEIRFDETQSMGEDFEFVLDYMVAAQITKCKIINEPLYYYIRYNNNSLMSKFGLIENDNEYKRLEKLRKICGDTNSKVEGYYQKAVSNTKTNYVYQICRNTSKTDSEKKSLIEHIMKEGNSARHLKKQKRLIIKEKLYQKIQKFKQLPKRAKGKFVRKKNQLIIRKARKLLKAKDFSIISQNCIGGVFYHDMEMEFLTPTVNLFFKCSDFICFVLNIHYYLDLELQMVWEEEYPVGVLDDVKIYFMHYKTCREAIECWEKRKKRINWNKIIVVSTDMESMTDDVYKQWEKIAYPKVLYSATARQANELVYYPKYEKLGKVANLIPTREFYKDDKIIETVNYVESRDTTL